MADAAREESVGQQIPQIQSLHLDRPPPWRFGKTCELCKKEFGVMRREHHCRNCGGAFCQDCSSKNVPLPRFGFVDAVRVCHDCHLAVWESAQTDQVAPKWTEAKECHCCSEEYSLVNRQHHCRCCGNSFCAKCASKTSPVPKYGFVDAVRVCDECYSTVWNDIISQRQKKANPNG